MTGISIFSYNEYIIPVALIITIGFFCIVKKKNEEHSYEISLADGIIHKKKVVQKEEGAVKKRRMDWYEVVGYAGQFGFSIALPIAGGAIGGSYLDKKWGSSPMMTVVCLVLGVALSGIQFVNVIHTISKRN